MADAAWAMFSITLASTMVAGAGIYFVFRSLEATRESTKAALEAVQVTREIGERQVRAYMSVEDYSLLGRKEDVKTGKSAPDIVIHLRNGGQSPAKNVAIIAGWSTAEPRTRVYVDRNKEHSVRDYGSGAKEIFRVDTEELLGEQLLALVYGVTSIWIDGVIEYDDVFGHHHETHFKTRMAGSENGEEFSFFGSQDGNYST